MIPQRIAEEARAILAGRRMAFDNESGAPALVEAVATALFAAEQCGREMEREECAQFIMSRAANFAVSSQNPSLSEEAADICRIFESHLDGVATLIRSRSITTMEGETR